MAPTADGKKGKRPQRAAAPRSPRKRGAAARPGDVEGLAAKLGLVPRRRGLFRRALTHKSAEQELGLESNERLEFLGDAVLGLVLAEHLHRSHPDLAEGDLTKLKAVAVSEPILAAVGRELGIGRFLLLAKGEELTGGRDRSSILADGVEAIFAATYLDRGYRVARELILRLLADHLAAIERREYEPDYKTLLQEKIQEIHRTPPTYRVISQSGPDHDRTFVAEARIGRRVLGTGSGKSKKQAEQAAARHAIESQE
ncbi:MAG: ribonuclease III [Armatimonadetes bacterium]|nr:ribonuclease III [Armatimonadota bacterium]